MSALARQRLMFAAICLVWGTTWIAMKYGAMHVAPGIFAGTRWTTAGLVQLGYIRWRTGRLNLPWRSMKTLLLVGLLFVSLNQVFMLYAVRGFPSGLGAVINAGLTPVTLLLFAVMLGHERLTGRVVLSMFVGVAGVLVLFGPQALAHTLEGSMVIGALLVTLGTVTQTFGTVVARPMMVAHPPMLVAGVSNLLGGLMLFAGGAIFEPGAQEALRFDWDFMSWLSWLFLLVPGSLLASTLFLILVRDWGASKAGTYAFIVPIMAVVEGSLVNGEEPTIVEAAGMALMLTAAWVALRRG
jgi:drug/metabolite transporter (DMT)-like permease